MRRLNLVIAVAATSALAAGVVGWFAAQALSALV
jgi:hypothetical protein